MKSKHKFFLTIILLYLYILNSNAATLLVSKTGGQFTSINAAINVTAPGDTVLVKSGVYNELVTISKSGLKDKFITILGEAGAIVDATGVTLSGTCGLFYLENVSYIRIQGFTIRNAVKNSSSVFQAGIWVRGYGTDIQLIDNKISNIMNSLKNSGCHGIAVYGTDGARSVTNLLIKNNEIFNCQTGWSECLALNGNVDGFEVSGNLVHDNNNIGIDFIGFEGECPVQANDQARNGICVDNRIYNITSKGNLAYGSEQSADGIYVDGGKNILIERNIIDLCDIGIELASEHAGLSTQDITVRNNFVSRSVQGNLQAGGYDSKRGNTLNCVFANNTCYQAKEGELVLQYFCKDITIINNIFIGLSGKDYLNEWGSQNTNIIVKNNLYWGASTTETGQWTDNLAIFKDPKLKNSYLDMHLSKESPAIDKAFVYDAGMFDIDKNQRIIGNSSDIGADEFDPYASVENPVEEQLISVYPNPAKDDFVIKIPGQIVFPSALMVYNVQGELIMTDRISGNIYSGSTMQLVGKGIYFLKVINPRFSTNMKLIVQ